MRSSFGFVLGCSLCWQQPWFVCVTAEIIQQSRMENVGRIKHIIRVVTLYHKPFLKSLFQPAREEEQIPRCSWRSKVGCLSLSVFLSLL